MKIPFTIEQFLQVFENYNQSIWPFQIILNLIAIYITFLIFKKKTYSDKVINILLALLWSWTGIVYHFINFSSINSVAYLFGILFITQGLAFIYSGIIKNRLSFKYENNVLGITGIIFVIYALIIYPVLGYLLGHIYPKAPTFGVPCPTTIFTFGILLWTEKKVEKKLLIIPVLWSIIGFSAAVNLNIQEDFGLFLAGLLGLTLILIRDKRENK